MTVSISLRMRGSTLWSSSSGTSKTNSSWTCMIILVERAGFFDSVLDMDHRHLNDIRGCPLEGGIDGHSLRGLPDGSSWRMDLRKIAATIQEGRHIPFSAWLPQTLFSI